MKPLYYLNLGPWPYHVGFTTDAQCFSREMRRLKIERPPSFTASPHSNACAHFFWKDTGAATAIICIEPPPRKISREQYAAMIAHEAVHVIQDMRERLGSLGSEAEAYLVQQIVQEGLQIAWKTGRTIQRRPQP